MDQPRSTGDAAPLAKPERNPTESARVTSPGGETEARLAAQYQTARALADCLTLAQATPRILRAICESLGWEHSIMWSVDRGAGVLRWLESWHVAGSVFTEFEALSRRTTFRPGVGLPGRVWADKKPAWIPDVLQDANFPRAPIAAREGLQKRVLFSHGVCRRGGGCS